MPSAKGGYECGCPPGKALTPHTPLLPWLGRDSCVPLQALAAEAAARWTRQNRDFVPSPVRADGTFDCLCPAGKALSPRTPLLPWIAGDSCVPLQAIAAEAAARCTQQNRDLIPSPVRADGTFDCLCPDGGVWQPESLDNPRGQCVSARAQATDDALCESTMAGSVMGSDNQGRRACVCPSGYLASAADKKCVPDPANPGRAGWAGQVSGSWTSSCIYNGYPVEGTPSGGFTLTFDGRGAITGAFVEGANASISGTVAPDGALRGQGSVVMEGRRMALSLAGTVSRTPAGGLSASGTFTNGDGQGVTCTGRWGS